MNECYLRACGGSPWLTIRRIANKASQVALVVKNPPAIQETWVRSLSQEDPLEEEMATHSSILAWEIPWTEEPDGLQSRGSKRVRHYWVIEHIIANTYSSAIIPLKRAQVGAELALWCNKESQLCICESLKKIQIPCNAKTWMLGEGLFWLIECSG